MYHCYLAAQVLAGPLLAPGLYIALVVADKV